MGKALLIQFLIAPKFYLLAQGRRPAIQHNGFTSNMQTPNVGLNPNVHFVPGMNVPGPQFFLEQDNPSFEWHRRTGADARDPRCLGGPCQGSHQVLTRGANQHAAYYRCEDCRLRILYIPKTGARGMSRAAGPLPADVYGVAAPPAPPMPTAVPGMQQPSPANVKVGPKVSKTASCPHHVHPKQPPPANTAAQGPAQPMPFATAPPMASPPQSASASHKASSPAAPPVTSPMAPTGSMPASSSSALPQQEEILGALQSVMHGISQLSQRMENSELQANQTNASTQQIAQRLVQLEGRAQQTESALVETAQMAFTSHQMATSSLAPLPAASPGLSTIEAQPEGVETWHMPTTDPNQIEVPDLSLSDVVSEEEELSRRDL